MNYAFLMEKKGPGEPTDMPKNTTVSAYKQYHGYRNEFRSYVPPVINKDKNELPKILADICEDTQAKNRTVIIRAYDITTSGDVRRFDLVCKWVVGTSDLTLSSNKNVMGKDFFETLWQFSLENFVTVIKKTFGKFAIRKNNNELEVQISAFNALIEDKKESDLRKLFSIA